MANSTFRAEARLQQGVRVSVNSREFSFTLDEPEDLGGSNQGMAPVEALLGTLGACQAIVARIYADQFNVVLDDFRVELSGELDFDGLFGKAPVRPGFSAIRYDFHISSPSPKVRIYALIEHLLEHCPIGDSLAKPVPLQLNRVVIEAPSKPEASRQDTHLQAAVEAID